MLLYYQGGLYRVSAGWPLGPKSVFRPQPRGMCLSRRIGMQKLSRLNMLLTLLLLVGDNSAVSPYLDVCAQSPQTLVRVCHFCCALLDVRVYCTIVHHYSERH